MIQTGAATTANATTVITTRASQAALRPKKGEVFSVDIIGLPCGVEYHNIEGPYRDPLGRSSDLLGPRASRPQHELKLDALRSIGYSSLMFLSCKTIIVVLFLITIAATMGVAQTRTAPPQTV